MAFLVCTRHFWSVSLGDINFCQSKMMQFLNWTDGLIAALGMKERRRL